MTILLDQKITLWFINYRLWQLFPHVGQNTQQNRPVE